MAMAIVSRDEVNLTEPQPAAIINGREDVNIDDVTMKKRKKKAGPFGFFRAALVVLRSTDKNKKSASIEIKDEEEKKKKTNGTTDGADVDGNWKNFVGSMRPFHLQQDFAQSPPPAPTDDVLFPHHQYHHSFCSSPASSSGTMSQYASASNLQALDDGEEGNDPDVVFDALRGDELIDSKAEEFIAQFYQQMKNDKRLNLHQRTKTAQF